MRKFFSNIICSFIPSKKLRHKIRKQFASPVLPRDVLKMLKSSGFVSKKEAESVALHRLGTAHRYSKEYFATNSDIFEDIYQSNFWGSDESRSGPGSDIAATVMLRSFLLKIFKKYKIQSVLDTPCGDFNWMKLVDMDGISYIGGDISVGVIKSNIKKYGRRKNVQFQVIDITKDKLPKVDLIICKDCIQHLSEENIKKAIRNFKQSGAKYLLITSFPITRKNWDINDGDYRPINVQIPPFNFSALLDYVQERPDGRGVHQDNFMLLFPIKKVPNV